MYVLGPEILLQTNFEDGPFDGDWSLNAADYLDDGQITFYGGDDAEDGLRYENTITVEEDGDYLLSFDFFGSLTMGFSFYGGDDPIVVYAQGTVPLVRQSIVVHLPAGEYFTFVIGHDFVFNWSTSDTFFGYGTMNNISLKRILSEDNTVGEGGHVRFIPPYIQSQTLIPVSNDHYGAPSGFVPIFGDPFDGGGWTNNGTWVFNDEGNGRIEHETGDTGTATFEITPTVTGGYANQWFMIYFEIGGTQGSLQLDFGDQNVTTVDMASNNGPYDAQCRQSPEGRGYLFYRKPETDNNIFTLTPSSDFDGWVDNMFIRQVYGPE